MFGSSRGQRDDSSSSKIHQVKSAIGESRDQVEMAIDSAIDRGGKLTDLESKAEGLTDSSALFHKRARDVRRQFCVENLKLTLLTIFIFILFIVVCTEPVAINNTKYACGMKPLNTFYSLCYVCAGCGSHYLGHHQVMLQPQQKNQMRRIPN